MNDSAITFEEMSADHAPAVAALHAESIEESNMSDMGPGFLAELYRCLLDTGYGVGYVMLDGDRVVGFSFGRFSHELTMQAVMLRSFFRLLPQLLQVLLTRPAAALEGVRGLRREGHVVCEPGVGELLTIAVAPDARGGGGSRRVLELLFERLAREGCHAVRWETLGSNMRAQKYYTKIGGRVVRHTEVGGRPNLWFEKDLRPQP